MCCTKSMDRWMNNMPTNKQLRSQALKWFFYLYTIHFLLSLSLSIIHNLTYVFCNTTTKTEKNKNATIVKSGNVILGNLNNFLCVFELLWKKFPFFEFEVITAVYTIHLCSRCAIVIMRFTHSLTLFK